MWIEHLRRVALYCTIATQQCASELVCPKGSTQRTSGCVPCPAGTYRDEVSSNLTDTCTSCPNGQYLIDTATNATLHDDLSDCLNCSAGTEYVDNQTACATCESGKYQEQSGIASLQCKTCGVGQYAVSTLRARACSNGQYQEDAAAAATSCKTCPVGQFASDPEARRCLLCRHLPAVTPSR